MKRMLAAMLLLAAVSCRSTGGGETGIIGVPEESKDLEAAVKFLNENAAESFEGQFTVEGMVNKKKYRTLGSVTFTRAPRKMNLQITDFIFKSQLAVLMQDEKDLQIYFPVEKRLFIDSMDTMQLKKYSDIDFDFPILYELLSGSIPVLKGAHVKNTVAEEETGVRYLILENDKFYQTISFKNSLPDKILFKDKQTQERVEIYLQRKTACGKGLFYRTIKILAPERNLNLTIVYSDIKLNQPVKVKGVADMKLPKNISIIRQ